jgi:hypothetical protein
MSDKHPTGEGPTGEELTSGELTILRQTRMLLRTTKADIADVLAAIDNARPLLPEGLWRSLLLDDEMTEAKAAMDEAAQRIDCALDGFSWFMDERSISENVDKTRRAASRALRDRAVE